MIEMVRLLGTVDYEQHIATKSCLRRVLPSAECLILFNCNWL